MPTNSNIIPRKPQDLIPRTDDLLKMTDTDSGNSERLVRAFGPDIRYWSERKHWLFWDLQRWTIDDAGAILVLGRKSMRELFRQAGLESIRVNKAGLRERVKELGRLQQFALRSENVGGLSAMVKLAGPLLPIHASELDADPYLLNCLNGTLDLRSGRLRNHRRQDFLTKLCPVNYYPEAACPRFSQFLEEILPDEKIRRYLQRCIGYCLSGDVTEKAVFMLYGPSADNGKTTLCNVIRALLADYADQISIQSLCDKASDNNIQEDIASLQGRRFVCTSETKRGQRLNEQLLKWASGMGMLKAARKYEHRVEFAPTFKLWIEGNSLPQIRGDDEGLGVRLRVIPFDVKIEGAQKDRKLLEKLLAELPGILRWSLAGCLAWQRDGLGEPGEVLDAVREWRRRDDPLGDFLEEKCLKGPRRKVKVSEVFEAYAAYAKEKGIAEPLSQHELTATLKRKGFYQANSRFDGKRARAWVGIALAAPASAAFLPHRGHRVSMAPKDATKAGS